MNILFTYKNWLNPNRGGVGRVADTLARYFSDKGHRMHYLTHEFDKDDNYKFPAQVHILPDTDFFSTKNRNYYQNIIVKLSIDVIVNHDASNGRCLFWLNKGNANVKVISLYHTDPLHGLSRKNHNSLLKSFLYPLKVLKYRRIMEQLIKKSDKLVLLSNSFKVKINKELKLSTQKIVAIANPCVILDEQVGYLKSRQVLFVGRLDWSSKRVDRLMQIWKRVEKDNFDWELLILGDGPDRDKTENMARELNLKRVVFMGFVNPQKYYKSASILCMTSDYEGFGLVMPEAMQYGVVPIAFNNWSSLKDIIINDETGIIVESNTISEYVLKLNQLISKDKKREKMGREAAIDIQKFHINKIGPMWDALIDNL